LHLVGHHLQILLNQSTNQPTNQSINQSIKQINNQSVSHSNLQVLFQKLVIRCIFNDTTPIFVLTVEQTA